MVRFEIANSKDDKKLVITSHGKMTSLIISRPLTGRHALPRLPLDDIPKIKEWTRKDHKADEHFLLSPAVTSGDKRLFNTLGRRIISGEAKWGATVNVFGKFRYVPKYWEWAEDILGRKCIALQDSLLYDAVYASLFTYDKDVNIFRAFCEAWCSESNTLQTCVGEVSITPWDLNVIGGLPIVGVIYDEAIPYADELRTKDKVDSDTISAGCKFLFYAFHTLSKNDKVSLNDWVLFWFKGRLKHVKPHVQVANKLTRPGYIGNPDGVITSVDGWSLETKAVFEELGVPSHLYTEVYLAAFLSCWLCLFVFPDGSNVHIRPTTFKPASLMAVGRKVGLALPVLATIYKGLNVISTSATPGSSKSCFPIHYLQGWLAHYFTTHYSLPHILIGPKMARFSGQGGARFYTDKGARDLIHYGHSISWNATSFVRNHQQILAPSYKEKSLDIDRWGRFISIRPCMLSLRWDDQFILEPYSPRRFSRQFGFFQTTPTELGGAGIRHSTLEIGLQFWRYSIHEYSDTKAMIPPLSEKLRSNVTRKFKEWWQGVHGYYLIDGREKIIASTRKVISEPNTSSHHDVDVPQSSEVSSNATTPLVIPKRLEKRCASPIYCVEDSQSASECHHRRQKRRTIISADVCLNPQADDVPKRTLLPELEDQLVEGNFGEGNLNEQVQNVQEKRLTLEEPQAFKDDGSDGSLNHHAHDLPKKKLLLEPEHQLLKEKVGNSDNDLEKISFGESMADISQLLGECSSLPRMLEEVSNLCAEVPKGQALPKTSRLGTVDDVATCQNNYLKSLWAKLEEKLMGCSLEQLSSLKVKEEIYNILEGMTIVPKIDLSLLRSRVSTLFDKAFEYNQQCSLSLENRSTGSQKLVIEEKSKLLGVMHSDQAKCKTNIADLDKGLATIAAQIDELKVKYKEKKSLLSAEKSKVSKLQADITSLNEEVTTLKAQENEVEDRVEKLSKFVVHARGEIMCLNLFP